jgi:hypothetical protein
LDFAVLRLNLFSRILDRFQWVFDTDMTLVSSIVWDMDELQNLKAMSETGN